MVFHKNRKAQSIIEFTFSVIVIMFIIYGMVRVFRWAGMDLAQRRYAQDTTITMDLENEVNEDPTAQLNGDIGSVRPLAAIYRGGITTGNTSP